MIPVIYQNSDFVLIDKPAGLSFHSENSPGLAAMLKKQLQREVLYPVHRLDKMTSGLVLFALNKSAAQAFQRLFEAHEIEKYYLAISDTKPKKKQGWVIGDMVPARRGSWKLRPNRENPAKTRFISASLGPGIRLYLLKPFTGRTHQIRVAMKSISAPICGDLRYAEADQAKQEERGYLHAYGLRFSLFGEHYEFVLPPRDGERFQTAACHKQLAEWSIPWSLMPD